MPITLPAQRPMGAQPLAAIGTGLADSMSARATTHSAHSRCRIYDCKRFRLPSTSNSSCLWEGVHIRPVLARKCSASLLSWRTDQLFPTQRCVETIRPSWPTVAPQPNNADNSAGSSPQRRTVNCTDWHWVGRFHVGTSYNSQSSLTDAGYTTASASVRHQLRIRLVPWWESIYNLLERVRILASILKFRSPFFPLAIRLVLVFHR
jgi:hypothetical protein